MFGRGKKRVDPEPGNAARGSLSLQMRDFLFGDQPLDVCGARSGGVWDLFASALSARRSGDIPSCVAALEAVLATPDLESRHYLQAWSALRECERAPTDAEAKEVLGVVVEVGMPQGLDLLAAYADGSARYWNFADTGVVVDTPDARVRSHVVELLAQSATTVALIGPWPHPRPTPPEPGIVRLNFLTPSGLHFGQATMEQMARDPRGAGVWRAATTLLQSLVALAEANRGKR